MTSFSHFNSTISVAAVSAFLLLGCGGGNSESPVINVPTANNTVGSNDPSNGVNSSASEQVPSLYTTNRWMTGNFVYQLSPGEAAFNVVDVASGNVTLFDNNDWGSYFGPEDATNYFVRSVRNKKNPTLLISAIRIFGDDINAFLVSDFSGRTQHVLEFLPGWKIDLGGPREISHDGKYVAAYLTDPSGSRQLQVYSVQGEFIGGYNTTGLQQFIWLSNGQLLTSTDERRLELLNPFAQGGFGDGVFISIPDSVSGTLTSWDLSADESTLAYIVVDPGPASFENSFIYSLRLLNLQTGADRLIAKGFPRLNDLGQIFSPSWSYDGKWISVLHGPSWDVSFAMLAIPMDRNEVLEFKLKADSSPDFDHYSLDIVMVTGENGVVGWQPRRYNWVPK